MDEAYRKQEQPDDALEPQQNTAQSINPADYAEQVTQSQHQTFHNQEYYTGYADGQNPQPSYDYGESSTMGQYARQYSPASDSSAASFESYTSMRWSESRNRWVVGREPVSDNAPEIPEDTALAAFDAEHGNAYIWREGQKMPETHVGGNWIQATSKTMAKTTMQFLENYGMVGVKIAANGAPTLTTAALNWAKVNRADEIGNYVGGGFNTLVTGWSIKERLQNAFRGGHTDVAAAVGDVLQMASATMSMASGGTSGKNPEASEMLKNLNLGTTAAVTAAQGIVQTQEARAEVAEKERRRKGKNPIEGGAHQYSGTGKSSGRGSGRSRRKDLPERPQETHKKSSRHYR
ncbi:hypothetical protein [Streptomyces sp. OE57]|uniref:hypothetical protein n=1 Tax=Streptomyces lacaronensis TaxID=3379885 RepID=UPI0039B78F7E